MTPAHLLGIDDKVGSLAVGKKANTIAHLLIILYTIFVNKK